MAVLSGKTGKVTWNSADVSQVTSWTCTETAVMSKWASNNTSGYKNCVAGTKDWSGSFAFKYDSTIAPTVGQGTAIGSAVSLVLTADTSETLTGNAVVESIELSCDIDNGEIVSGVCNFTGNGVLTRT